MSEIERLKERVGRATRFDVSTAPNITIKRESWTDGRWVVTEKDSHETGPYLTEEGEWTYGDIAEFDTLEEAEAAFTAYQQQQETNDG